jgi:hypothetical protein
VIATTEGMNVTVPDLGVFTFRAMNCAEYRLVVILETEVSNEVFAAKMAQGVL